MIPKKGVVHPPSPAPIFFLFVAMQIERILDKKEKHATERNESSETTFPNLPLANIMFASILFPQTENAPVLDNQKLIKTFYKSAFIQIIFPSPDLERVSEGRVRGQT